MDVKRQKASSPLGKASDSLPRRLISLRSLALGLLISGYLAFTATPATALQTHPYLSQFDGATTPQHSLSALDGAAVDLNGAVYTTPYFDEVVYVFEPTGNYLAQISYSGYSPAGVAVAPNGAVYVNEVNSSSRQVVRFLPSSYPVTSTTTYSADGVIDSSGSSTAVAVNPANSHVFVDEGNKIVEYDAAGSLVQTIGSDTLASSAAVAVDASSGDVYAVNGSNTIDYFDSSGTLLGSFTNEEAAPIGPSSFAGIGVDQTSNHLLVVDATNLVIDEFDSSGQFVGLTDGTDTPQGAFYFTTAGQLSGSVLAVDDSSGPTAGRLYVLDYRGLVDVFGPEITVPDVNTEVATDVGQTSATLRGHIDPAGGGNITGCRFQYVSNEEYEASQYTSPSTVSCSPNGPYSSPTDLSAKVTQLSTETTYHYRLVAENGQGANTGRDKSLRTHAVVNLMTETATNVTPTAAKLNGSFVGNGEDTHYYFEWGTDATYGNTTPLPPGGDAGSPTGPSPTLLSVELAGLNPRTTYHYQVVATNNVGTSYGGDQTFGTPPAAPSIADESVSNVHSDTAVVHAEINPGGGDTTYHFEYGVNKCSETPHACTAIPIPDRDIGSGTFYQSVGAQLSGLTAGTTYHFSIVAANPTETVEGQDRTFTTFRYIPAIRDPCPNAHVRQQTGAALLLDCRAYELVSAPNSGGYDVESDLVPGQAPYGGYPLASGATGGSRILYGVHDGAIPTTGNPTNHGVDPYVATRTSSGWETKYVGIPANDPFASAPFASTLEEADPSLDTVAFGGPSICSPCFGPGQTETGEPIHLPNGELVQGMAGSIPQPTAKPAGFIGKHFSADGAHFVFGSKSKFEPDANEGEIAIYDRNLTSDETHVASKTPSGETMEEEGKEVGELDISKDGSRIVIGHLVEEVQGAKYWHLYMNIGDSGETIDLTPGTIQGVLFDGMTEDGSKVFFTTVDKLTGDDEDHSADIYEAEVTETGATLTRISTDTGTGAGGPGNSDLCQPSANTVNEHWTTTVSGEENCGAVAVGGGGGVASGGGTIYFLSPELLDGTEEPEDGVQNAPNLYAANPGGTPRFVATLESSLSSDAQLPEAVHPFLHLFGALTRSTGIALDAKGDTYVLDVGAAVGEVGAYVQKFDPAGKPISNFAEGGTLNGSGSQEGAFVDYGGTYGLPTEIAVDNDPSSSSYGDLYVPDLVHNVVDKFSPTGDYLSQIDVSLPSAVAINKATGDVYVTSLFGGVSVYQPNGTAITSFSTILEPTGIAVDESGTVYVVNGGGLYGINGTTEAYGPTSASPLEYNPPIERQLNVGPSLGVAVDPSDDHVYVDEGSQVTELDSSGSHVGGAFGSGHLAHSLSLAVDGGALDVSSTDAGDIAAFGPAVRPPDPDVDSHLVIDGVNSTEARNTADFQLTPDGNDAVFTSTLPLTGYEHTGFTEVYRYDDHAGLLTCVSCGPTNAQPTGGATLATKGLSLTNDGRVFFNSTDALAPRDLDEREDVYEWEPQGTGNCQPEQPNFNAATDDCTGLISTGSSPFASSLLGVSADGTDVSFFTKDSLVPQDENGELVKLYDARELGGFPYVPAPPPCKASDECHGAGSPAPDPPPINSVSAGRGNEAVTLPCKAGLVKKHGKCVKRHRKSGRHHRRHGAHPHG